MNDDDARHDYAMNNYAYAMNDYACATNNYAYATNDTMLTSPNINASYTAGLHNWSHNSAHHVILDDPFQTVEPHPALSHLQRWMQPLINFE